MKIALVSPYDFTWPGGVTAHISELSRHLVQNGHNVKVLAPYSSTRGLPPDIDFIPLGKSVPVPAGGSTARLTFSVWLHRKVSNILKQENFDIIHLHEPLMPFLPLSVLRSSKSVNIGTFHAVHGKFRNYGWSHHILKYWFNKLDGLIAVSPAAAKYAGRFFSGDFRIIPNGIDIDHFAIPKPHLLDIMDGKLNILFVGRLEKRKGLKYLLEAYAKLRWDFDYMRLIIVGPGNLDKDCHRILSERNLHDVVFKGGISSYDLPRYYQAADICVAPATGRESFGIVLLEAMAAGKPIVASNIEGYASVLTHGDQGLLVPPKDSNSLAAALEILIRNPEFRASMGAKGRQTVENYRWGKVSNQVLDYYSQISGITNGKIRKTSV